MKFYITLLIIVSALIISCNEDPPVVHEGGTKLTIVAIGDTTVLGTTPQYVPLKNAKVILSSEYGTMIKYTDSEGKLELLGIPSSTYGISVRVNHPAYANILLVGSVSGKEIISGKTYTDTVVAKQVANTGIAINEIYSCGPVNTMFFFYDLFFELYNSSDEVKYLDGMMMMRVTGDSDKNIKAGEDYDNDGDIDGVSRVFKFPGQPGEKNYPFYPGTFLVLASTAVNHQKTIPTSIDLSGADWEFYNQYSVTDFDNPNVANLINMRPDQTIDFLVGLNSDLIILSSGVDSNWEDGIVISTILDGVEFEGSATSPKTLDARVDKSSVVAPSRYSGKSLQRREPGGDSNDAVSDWEIIPAPTPGRQ